MLGGWERILLSVREHELHVARINFLDDGGVAQSPFLLCTFLSQDMSFVSMLALNLTASCYFEAFFRS